MLLFSPLSLFSLTDTIKAKQPTKAAPAKVAPAKAIINTQKEQTVELKKNNAKLDDLIKQVKTETTKPPK
jgi:hypothetical protein